MPALLRLCSAAETDWQMDERSDDVCSRRRERGMAETPMPPPVAEARMTTALSLTMVFDLESVLKDGRQTIEML